MIRRTGEASFLSMQRSKDLVYFVSKYLHREKHLLEGGVYNIITYLVWILLLLYVTLM